jgi:hypothetical protein
MKHIKSHKMFESKTETPFEEALRREVPDWVIEWVWNSTPAKEIGGLKEYEKWVESKYKDFFVTHHYSQDDGILMSDLRTPKERGRNFNSADAFFVSPNLKITQGDKFNFFVMVPRDLEFLLTDYNFSNAPEMNQGFKYNRESDEDFPTQRFSWIGNRARELGWSAIVPDGGRYEIAVVRPERLVVLGSMRDLEGFRSSIDSMDK